MISEVPLQGFFDELAAPSATPGGGSTAAIMGAMAAALVSMVCGLTAGRRGYAAVENEMKAVLDQAESLRARLTSMIEEDVRAYGAVMGAYGLPRGTEAERRVRSEAIQAALAEATLAPLACARACAQVMALARIVAEKGNLNAAGEAGAAALAAHAALRSSALNVYINTGDIRDRGFVESRLAEIDGILLGCRGLDATVFELVRSRLSQPAQ